MINRNMNAGCLALVAAVGVFALIVFARSFQSIAPGHVGVTTTFGRVNERILMPGLNFKPLWQSCTEIDCKVQQCASNTECFSKDLQLVTVAFSVQYRLPENNAVKVFSTIGLAYLSQVTPVIDEVLKQEVAKFDSEEIISKRDLIRANTSRILSERVKGIVDIKDVILTNVQFSDAYEKAIEQKQVAMQEALRAKHELDRATIEAQKLIAIAEGEAKAIRIKGEAINTNPKVVQLEAINKWNGVAPTTVVLGKGEDVPVVFPVK